MSETLTITRTFDAPRALVWEAWFDPDSRVGFWGPSGFTFVSQQIDLRVGGTYRLAMRSPEGEVVVNGGTYREVEPQTRVVMTHGWEDGGVLNDDTVITLRFSEEGGRTVMHFEQTGFDTAAMRDSHDEGWTEAFDALDAALKSAA
jgi:uncharacterized protein YndB with AHSA1/START domain